jgi:hypothetical protein
MHVLKSTPKILVVAVLAAAMLIVYIDASGAEDLTTYRRWIEDMKQAERGPFSQIRWFCRDGAVLPPKAGCADHGGGFQHGEWSDRTETLRSRGYKIANVLAGIDAEEFVREADFLDSYAQLVIEKFLIGADNGWILRRAQFYRGAIQEEDEREAARDLLTTLCGKPDWIGFRYSALRVGARLLPHGEDTGSVLKVRQLSTALAERDSGFERLRVKIHGTPDGDDAKRVREYASQITNAELRAKYMELASEIDRVYRPVPLEELLEKNASFFTRGPWLQQMLREARTNLSSESSPAGRYRVTARLLADLRDALPKIQAPSARLRVLDLSLVVEAEHFRVSSELRHLIGRSSRAEHVFLLRSASDAAYGTSMINRRQREELAKTFAALPAEEIRLKPYLQELRYLGLMPGWSAQTLRFHFSEAMARLGEIEPLAHQFIQDQLRGSPLLFYSHVLDRLMRDGNRVAGVEHRLFDQNIGTGFNALNPGIARGMLHAEPDMNRIADFRPGEIYVLPETVAELPPVGGILTTGHGNPLSHVQLLARNLGIPNVAVDESLLPALQPHDGEKTVLAVSPGGLVEISKDGSRWDAVFGNDTPAAQSLTFEPDATKLDLSVRDFVSLDTLRAADSGRIVGPKAAKLGELKSQFPESVAPGLAIPFGLYRETVLDRPHRNSDKTVYQWMVASFRKLESLPKDSSEARDYAETLRAEIYDIVRTTDPGPMFRQRLRAAMAKVFGPEFSGGVFVRSDTNVEDLPGFSGAGLNRTLPNVVGFENIVKAIPEVWASPYTVRAFAWRQLHMQHPEHVYPAVLLLRTVPSEKSGVMITQDIDTGDRNMLTVAVNEGVGGAVEGQGAESLRVDRRSGAVRLMATATAPRRMLPQPAGGVAKLPASGSETLLQPDEIRQLIALSDEIPRRFPPIEDSEGNLTAADVEFGFVDGKLWLFQIRPFNESRTARSNAYLIRMDQMLEKNLGTTINMREVIP